MNIEVDSRVILRKHEGDSAYMGFALIRKWIKVLGCSIDHCMLPPSPSPPSSALTLSTQYTEK